MSKILERVVAKTTISDIVNILTNLSGTDLQSLLLEVYRNKAKNLKVKNVVKKAKKSKFVRPSTARQRDLITFDNVAYNNLPDDFKSVELSPVAPFATNSVLGGISQNGVLTTTRNVEVVGDPTSSLSILCAQGRKSLLKLDYQNADRVSMATSHRIIRQQSFKGKKGYTPHFRLFSLATAGRDQGSKIFEKEVAFKHLMYYLWLLNELNGMPEYQVNDINVTFSDVRIIEALIDKYQIDRTKLIKKSRDRRYSFFSDYSISLPSLVGTLDEFSQKLCQDYGFEKSINLLRIIEKSVVHSLREMFPHVIFSFDLERVEGAGYYSTLCFRVSAKNFEQKTFRLVGGGMTNWTQKILNSRKERFFAGAMGSELFCKFFKKP